MIYEHALDLVDVTTKCLKAAVAVRQAKGAAAIPHVEALVREARLAWGDACEAESQAWGESHAVAGAPPLPQETLALGDPAPSSSEDPEARLAPLLESKATSFHEAAAHAALPMAGDDGAPPLEPQGETFEEMEPPLAGEAITVPERFRSTSSPVAGQSIVPQELTSVSSPTISMKAQS